jgi:hypothetical protein
VRFGRSAALDANLLGAASDAAGGNPVQPDASQNKRKNSDRSTPWTVALSHKTTVRTESSARKRRRTEKKFRNGFKKDLKAFGMIGPVG